MSLSAHKAQVNAIFDLHGKCLHWKCKSLVVSLHDSPTDPNTREINVIETIGKRKAYKRNTVDSDWYWLPPHLNENTDEFRKARVIPYLALPALNSGFTLISQGWDERTGDGFLPLQCNRGQVFKPKKKKAPEPLKTKKKGEKKDQSEPKTNKKKRRIDVPNNKKKKKDPKAPQDVLNRTLRPVPMALQSHGSLKHESETKPCKFKFNVYWDEDRKRWKLPKEQAGCAEHSGHPENDPDEISAQTKTIGEDEEGAHHLSLGESKSSDVVQQP